MRLERFGMVSEWTQWWCQQFGYGSCASMPLADSFALWAGTAAGLAAVAYGIGMMISGLLINRHGGHR